ncbi:hypothetical protein H5410_037283 [Solanum commersonii]|uniref:Retrotransposon Copia-like N-terminal domain-containing protein n=1 Tax=Solanum commersonii TaxID=4109 RepID=A0A9J5Y5U4_SOLCO|nr:hypothetical protein H5410_037283 [Solanum commersonii]
MPNNLNNNTSVVQTPANPTTSNQNSGISPPQTIMNPLNQGSQLVSINQPTQLPIRLAGSTNYVTWKAQFDALCLGYDLTSYIDDVPLVPMSSRVLPTENTPPSSSSSPLQTHSHSTSPSGTHNEETSPSSSTTVPALSNYVSASPLQQVSSTPSQPPTRVATRSQNNIFKPKKPTDYSAFVVSTDTTVVPRTYE